MFWAAFWFLFWCAFIIGGVIGLFCLICWLLEPSEKQRAKWRREEAERREAQWKAREADAARCAALWAADAEWRAAEGKPKRKTYYGAPPVYPKLNVAKNHEFD